MKYLISYKIYRKHTNNVKLLNVDTCIRKLNISEISNISKLKNKINPKLSKDDMIEIVLFTKWSE